MQFFLYKEKCVMIEIVFCLVTFFFIYELSLRF